MHKNRTPKPAKPYKFFCSKCNYTERVPRKEDVKAIKLDHSISKCGLLFAPLSETMWTITRPEIAKEMREEFLKKYEDKSKTEEPLETNDESNKSEDTSES